MTEEEAKKYFVVHTDNKETLRNALKKIEELEQENAELKKVNAETLSQLNLDNGELIIENEKLRKENATLKKQLDALSSDIPWNELKDVSEVTKQLTEAKEIIRWFVVYEKGEGIITNYNNFLEQAENFLKE